MSGEHRRAAAPQNPPWFLDSLADLHAGALDPNTAARTRDMATEDPQARHVLAALDSTTHDLGTLAAEPVDEAIPQHVAERLENALAEQLHRTAPAGDETTAAPHSAHAARSTTPQPGTPQPGTPQPDTPASIAPASAASQPTTPRPAAGQPHHTGLLHTRNPARGGAADHTTRRRRRFLLTTGGVLAAAASLATVAFAFTPLNSNTTEQAQSPPHLGRTETHQHGPSDAEPIALHGTEVDLNGAQLAHTIGKQRYAGLADPTTLPGCLRANGITEENPIGAHDITLNGDPAQLFVLSTGELGQFRLLAVGPNCGPGNPATISDSTVGGT